MPTEGGLGGSCMVRALTPLAIPKAVLTHARSPVGILHLEGSLAFSTWSVKVLLLLASPDTPTGIPLFSENCSNSSWNHLWPQCFPNPSVPMSKLRLSEGKASGTGYNRPWPCPNISRTHSVELQPWPPRHRPMSLPPAEGHR